MKKIWVKFLTSALMTVCVGVMDIYASGSTEQMQDNSQKPEKKSIGKFLSRSTKEVKQATKDTVKTVGKVPGTLAGEAKKEICKNEIKKIEELTKLVDTYKATQAGHSNQIVELLAKQKENEKEHAKQKEDLSMTHYDEITELMKKNNKLEEEIEDLKKELEDAKKKIVQTVKLEPQELGSKRMKQLQVKMVGPQELGRKKINTEKQDLVKQFKGLGENPQSILKPVKRIPKKEPTVEQEVKEHAPPSAEEMVELRKMAISMVIGHNLKAPKRSQAFKLLDNNGNEGELIEFLSKNTSKTQEEIKKEIEETVEQQIKFKENPFGSNG